MEQYRSIREGVTLRIKLRMSDPSFLSKCMEEYKVCLYAHSSPAASGHIHSRPKPVVNLASSMSLCVKGQHAPALALRCNRLETIPVHLSSPQYTSETPLEKSKFICPGQHYHYSVTDTGKCK